MSKTAAELLLEMNAKATKGPWFVVGPPWNRGEPFINAWTEDPHGGQPICDFAIQAENDDGGPRSDPHPIGDAVLTATLRNALPQLAAVCEAAVASNEALVRTLGGRMSVSFTGKEIPNPARAMQHVTAFDAALADLTAALGEKP